MRYLIFFLLLLSCASCGYRSMSAPCEHTVAIPFVEGDQKGEFTRALTRVAGESGLFEYGGRSADYELKVCLMSPKDRYIGYAYTEKRGRPTKVTTSNEARVALTAKVELIDRRNQCTLVGPLKITSDVDYDFVSNSITGQQDHRLSLGQLEMHNLAKEIAQRELYPMLAEKIIDYVRASW